jgi:hypothetical protein
LIPHVVIGNLNSSQNLQEEQMATMDRKTFMSLRHDEMIETLAEMAARSVDEVREGIQVVDARLRELEERGDGSDDGGDGDGGDTSGCRTSPKAAVVTDEREVLLEMRECFVGRAHHLIKEQRRCLRTYEQKSPHDAPTPHGRKLLQLAEDNIRELEELIEETAVNGSAAMAATNHASVGS